MFQFDEYTLDLDRGHLRTAEREIELRPKSFEVLRYLVESGGRLVSKDELIKAVWPDVTVTDESLIQCVSEVRQAIGDRDQTKIRTVPRRGYRFAVPVTGGPANAVRTPNSEILFTDCETSCRSERPTARPSIAVLPFVNLSGDAHQEYFSDGVTADIITELSRFSELLVIARTSTFRYKGKAVDVRQVGRELGVRYVLEGGVRRAGNRIRVIADLIDATTGAHLWADRYDRELRDDFAVQDEVVRSVVTILSAHVNKAETERTLVKPPAAWEAYDYYLRGAQAFNSAYTNHTQEQIYEARALLAKSLSIDPSYARAYALLARIHVYTYLEPVNDDYLSASALELAYEFAKRAVQLDSNLPEGHSHLGWVLMFLRQLDASLAEFELAIVLNRHFNDHGYGLALVHSGDPARAIEVLRANLRVDPFQFRRLGVLGHAYYMLGRYEEAVPPARECASCVSNMRAGHLWLAAAYAQLGQLGEARLAAADVLRIEPAFTIDNWKRVLVYRNPEDAEHFIGGLRKAGLPQR